jgi:hypothetical protein
MKARLLDLAALFIVAGLVFAALAVCGWLGAMGAAS